MNIKYTSSNGKSVCILPASAVHISDEAEHTKLFNGINAFEPPTHPHLANEVAHILAQALIENDGFHPSSKFEASVIPWPNAQQPWPIFVNMRGGTPFAAGDSICDFYPENWVAPDI